MTQHYGATGVAQLPAACSILLIHGAADDVLPPARSQEIFRLAHEPKRLAVFPGAGHVLDEAADDVYRAVQAWLTEHLS